MLGRMYCRDDTAANWSSNNPTLLSGEIGYDTTNRIFKVGDGATAWNSLNTGRLLDPRINTIKDTNGNTVLAFTPIASAVNYIGVQNNVAGAVPRFYAGGSDTNVDLAFAARGTGHIKFLDEDNDGEIDFDVSGSSTNIDMWLNAKNAGRVYAALGKRKASTASTTSWTIDANGTDLAIQTALAGALTVNAPTGSPSDGQPLTLRIKDNATARAITWNAIWRFEFGHTAPTTTVISKWMWVQAAYNSTDTKWDVLAVGKQI